MLIGIDASRAIVARRTGTEHYARALTAAVVDAAPHHRFRLYFNAPPPPDDPWLASQPNVTRVSLPRRRLWTHLALGPALARHPPDIFWEPAHVLPLQHPPASVVTVHDLGYEYFPEAHTQAQRLYLKLTTRWHAFAARAILADSEATRRDLISLYRADAGKIHVVYPGIDPRPFQAPIAPEALAALRARYDLPPRYLLSVGTLQPRKNLARLIEAFAQVASEAPDLVLALVGQRGWGPNTLEQQVDRLGLAGRVRFLGYLPDAELPGLVRGALAFGFPSLFEGFGFPILEAQASGTPVLTSTTSSCPEVAGDGALLVPPESSEAIAAALRRLIHDETLRASLVARGTKNISRFTWEAAATQVLTIFDTLAR